MSTLRGTCQNKFSEIFGREIGEVFKEQIQTLTSLGWLLEKEENYEITREGLYFIDNISKFFYTEENQGTTQPWLKNLYNFIPEKYYSKRVSR